MNKAGKQKKPASELENIIFPKCARDCLAIEQLGAGECEAVCPQKFINYSKE